MSYIYVYAAIGALVAIWFFMRMRGWAEVGNRMGGGRTGTLKLLLMLPFVVAFWPLAAFVLWSDK